MQFIFAYNYLDNKDNRPQKACAWVYFEWIERAFLRSPLNDVFVGIFWKVIFFFLYKNTNVNYLVAHPNPQNACMRCMPMITLRGQEEKNPVLLRRFTQRLMRLTICRPAGLSSLVRTRITWTKHFFLLIRYIRFNSWKLTCNFSCNTISMRLYYPINRYRKKPSFSDKAFNW